MMLSLAWEIEDVVEFNNKEYALNLEFSNVLRWYEAYYKDDNSQQEKVILTFQMIYSLTEEEIVALEYEVLEHLYVSALKLILDVGDEPISAKEEMEPQRQLTSYEPTTKYFDFVEDAEYIFASFLYDYNINLIETRRQGKLHWNEFTALLGSLSEESKLRRVIAIRKMKIPDKASTEERNEILEAKKAVALRDNKTSVEFEAMDLLQKREWYEKQKNKGGEVDG